MRIYIAAPLRRIEDARALATLLHGARLDVASTWHRLAIAKPNGVHPDAALTDAQCAGLADTNRRDLATADACVMLFGHGRGHVHESGLAAGRGLAIVWVGDDAEWLLETAMLRGYPGMYRAARLDGAV